MSAHNKRWFRVALAVASVVVLIATSAGTAQAQTRLKVLTTTTILLDVAKNVAGDKADLASIVPPDGDAHDFEPSPTEIRLVADAGLVFVNGAGFEGFMDKLIADSGTKATVVTVSHGIAIRPLAGDTHDEEHSTDAAKGEEHHEEIAGISGVTECGEHEEHSADATKEAGHEDEHGVCDPHLWQDPINVMQYALNMRNALVAADPANAAAYTENTARYIVELGELDAEVWAMIAPIPAEKRVLVTNHDAMGYFAARYGFKVAGVVLPGGGTGAEPSPQEVAALIEEIKALGVPAIFTENIANNRLAQQIADEAGVKVIQALYTDALGAAGTPGETYIGMIRSNAAAIAGALLPAN